ncbi:conserved hypothetical protein [Desulfosarcina cetonica]|uniref:lipopolysaccharide transport periplasmic protein LptA n=1 Tax=Desulfosarcina cetonica TaxID=90730 RepID=UPI0006D26E3B|nr:lipopolysaccharide transport periplasmic protein LptA [Desulfosarcina cetonica]VTR64749.1 conserved hypothetical protein [Desulfosarcina cetonica]
MKIFNSNRPGHLFAAVALGMLIVVAVYPAALGAEKTTTPATGTPAPKIHITSEQLVSDPAHNQAEFIGNVHATQGETHITADSLKIFFAKSSGADNSSPAQSMEKLVASGNVKIKFDNRLAVARKAVYITAKRVLILTGPGATVTSGDNTISGETITYYRTDGRFTVESRPGGQVKATILPEDSGLE